MRIDKRYQVFVSSTYTDLVDERREIMQALLELDCIPSGMELFQAADEDSWSLIRSVIDDCDYYIVVVAGRYGSQHPETGQSYTEMEYRYATEKGVPVIAFLHEDISKLSSAVVDAGESREKLDSFRALCQEKQVKYWKNAAELGSVASRSLIRLTKEKPGVGWVRADALASDEAREQLLKLKEENEALREELSSAKSAYTGDVNKLAQGDDAIPVKWSGTYERETDKKYLPDRATYIVNGEISIDRVFRLVAPAMVDEISEVEFRNRVNIAFSEKFNRDEIEFDFAPTGGENEKVKSELKNIRATDETFQKIKVQMMALNLIKRGEKKRPPSDKANYWRITDEGEKRMMSLLAIKKAE